MNERDSEALSTPLRPIVVVVRPVYGCGRLDQSDTAPQTGLPRVTGRFLSPLSGVREPENVRPPREPTHRTSNRVGPPPALWNSTC